LAKEDAIFDFGRTNPRNVGAARRDCVMPLGRRVTEFDEQQWKQLRAILTSARLMDGSLDLARPVNYDILKEAYRKPISFGN
jgi:hypothetical protein